MNFRYEGSLSGSSTSTGSFGEVGETEKSELIRYVGGREIGQQ